MSNITYIRLTKEYKSIQTSPLPNAIIIPESTNWLLWRFVLYNLEGQYASGIYYGELKFPKNYPMGPPSIRIHTPSGRFVPGSRICTSMSDFHPETWSSSWTITSIIVGLISYMYDNEQGVGTIVSTLEQQKQFAKESLFFNMKIPQFRSYFSEYFENLLQPVEVATQTKSRVKLFSKKTVAWILLSVVIILALILLLVFLT